MRETRGEVVIRPVEYNLDYHCVQIVRELLVVPAVFDAETPASYPPPLRPQNTLQ